jgi:hypothetical protein
VLLHIFGFSRKLRNGRNIASAIVSNNQYTVNCKPEIDDVGQATMKFRDQQAANGADEDDQEDTKNTDLKILDPE